MDGKRQSRFSHTGDSWLQPVRWSLSFLYLWAVSSVMGLKDSILDAVARWFAPTMDHPAGGGMTGEKEEEAKADATEAETETDEDANDV